jgi:hypothetical protein
MFLCPCEIDLRTLISFRICHVWVKQNDFLISLIETWAGENGCHPGGTEPFKLRRLSRSSTHHVLPTRHEALVDDLQRDARHQPSAGDTTTERHPTRRSAQFISCSEADLACVVLACARQNTQVSRLSGFWCAYASRNKGVPVLMWTHSDRVKGCVRASKYSVRGVREGEGFRFRQPPLSITFSGVQGAVSGSSAARTFDDGVGTLSEGLQ